MITPVHAGYIGEDEEIERIEFEPFPDEAPVPEVVPAAEPVKEPAPA